MGTRVHMCVPMSTYTPGVKDQPLSPRDQGSNIKASWESTVLPHRIVTLFSCSERPALALSQVGGVTTICGWRAEQMKPLLPN